MRRGANTYTNSYKRSVITLLKSRFSSRKERLPRTVAAG